MLRNDAIYNLSFRFQDIDFNNVNDIYFVINIIVIIAITLFKTFIFVAFIFKFVVVIVINVNIIIIIIIIIVFEKSVFKFIAFDFDIKKRLIMNALFDKS